MRKELNNLTINDVVYFAKKDSTQYAHCKLVSINKKYCLFTHQYDIKDNYGVKRLTSDDYMLIVSVDGSYKPGEAHSFRSEGYGHKIPMVKHGYAFANESDARRYCKAQLMKELYKVTADAKAAVARLVAMRNKYFDELNNRYTEKAITDLEMIEI